VNFCSELTGKFPERILNAMAVCPSARVVRLKSECKGGAQCRWCVCVCVCVCARVAKLMISGVDRSAISVDALVWHVDRVCVYVCVCVCTCVCVHMCESLWVRVCVCVSDLCTYVFVCARVCVCVHLSVCASGCGEIAGIVIFATGCCPGNLQ